MIKFLSLYLGLLTGVQPVQVVVGGEVAAVEIFLDGASVGSVTSEPWRLEVDFGPELLPRDLVAVAYDREERELGRAEQPINLPRAAAEAGIVLERSEAGTVVAARVSWQSLARARPLGLEATLDGVPLAVDDPERIPIPAYDPEQLHVLVVDLRFTRDDVVQVVAGFGGTYFSDVTSELTAVPVVAGKRRLPPPEELQGAVLAGGEPLAVVAAERGGGEILFVRDPAASAAIDELGGSARGVGGFGVSSATGIATSAGGISGVAASASDELRNLLTLDEGYRIRLIWPATRRVERDEVRMELFPASPPFTADEGGIYWALTQKFELDGVSQIQRLTDAVAVAGLTAAAGNRPRAVVLVLGPSPQDHSRYDAATVRRYLRSLGVPLYVWAMGVEEEAASFPQWGEVEVLSSLKDLRRAARRLDQDLQHQAILWVEGRHLPQSLALAPGAAVEPVVP